MRKAERLSLDKTLDKERLETRYSPEVLVWEDPVWEDPLILL